jgi:hypothetical protein
LRAHSKPARCFMHRIRALIDTMAVVQAFALVGQRRADGRFYTAGGGAVTGCKKLSR